MSESQYSGRLIILVAAWTAISGAAIGHCQPASEAEITLWISDKFTAYGRMSEKAFTTCKETSAVFEFSYDKGVLKFTETLTLIWTKRIGAFGSEFECKDTNKKRTTTVSVDELDPALIERTSWSEATTSEEALSKATLSGIGLNIRTRNKRKDIKIDDTSEGATDSASSIVKFAGAGEEPRIVAERIKNAIVALIKLRNPKKDPF